MHIQFECQKCQKQLRVPEGQEGKTLKCPGCESLVRVPRQKKAAVEDEGAGGGTKKLRNPASIRHAKRNRIRDAAESWEAIRVELLPEGVVVAFAHGDLRGHVFETRLEKELRELCELLPEQFLVMDFDAIEYVPSRVLSILIDIARTLQERNVSLRFFGMNKTILKTMDMVGLGQIVSLYPNRALALKDIAETHNKKLHVRREKRLGHDSTSLLAEVKDKRPLQIKLLLILAAATLLAIGVIALAVRSAPQSTVESE